MNDKVGRGAEQTTSAPVSCVILYFHPLPFYPTVPITDIEDERLPFKGHPPLLQAFITFRQSRLAGPPQSAIRIHICRQSLPLDLAHQLHTVSPASHLL